MTNESAVFVDSHAHLDDHQFLHDVETVVADAVAVGVAAVVNIGYCPERWRSTMALAARFSAVAYTLGLHPHHADEWSGAVESELAALLQSSEAVALGEIGLDFFREGPPKPVQEAAFVAQLDLAGDLGMPVVIHQRAAESDVVRVLQNAPPTVTCVLHSFDGTEALAQLGLDRGYFFGVGGLMTRPSAKDLRSIIRGLPLDQLLLETDAPFLAPAGVNDRRNAPKNIPLIASAIAELKGISVMEVAKQTTANALRVFNLSPTIANVR